MNDTRIRLRTTLALAVAAAISLAGCARQAINSRADALRPASAPEVADDLGRASLISAIDSQLEVLSKKSEPKEFIFGEKRVPRERYLKALKDLRNLAAGRSSDEEYYEEVQRRFEFYEVYGDTRWGSVFLTSYFEPVIRASRSPAGKHTQAIYSKPDDLLPGVIIDNNGPRPIRAREVNKTILPYFTREEIDSKHALDGRNLEICYADPVDVYLLQVQGSGTVVFDDGEQLYLNFADKNGLPYRSLGKALREVMPGEDLTLPKMETFLRAQSPTELARYLNQNPSYVFFTRSGTHAMTSSGVPAFPGRTIATDDKFFPKGALAFLSFEHPVFDEESSAILGTETHSRFVLDQDVGGAIRGPGRVDLFWGRGDPAKHYAGVIKSRGRLYYLVPKDEE